jgi:hypothetical protein
MLNWNSLGNYVIPLLYVAFPLLFTKMEITTQCANFDVHSDFGYLNMSDHEDNQVAVPLIEPHDMAVVPMQTSERRLSAVVSVNNQQLLVVG